MAKDKSSVDNALSVLEEALQKQYKASYGIKREGTQISVPDYMTLEDASQAIIRYNDEQNEVMESVQQFFGHPHDCLVAFYRAVSDTFGELTPGVSRSFFGVERGKKIQVPISATEVIDVPIGIWELPFCPVKFEISMHFFEDVTSGNGSADSQNKRGMGDDKAIGAIVVKFTLKRLYEPLISVIAQKTRENIHERSIFRGSAIDSNFSFIDLRNFDTSRVVFTEREQVQIDANILSPVRHTKAWLSSGSQLKRGILLAGPYGTGKTLTALMTAKVCEDNGWTFVNALPGSNIAQMIRVAIAYEPSVVFFEDIDADAGAERTDVVNNILNTIDGMLSKSNRVMVILTTNHADKINKAMLRPGRLDSVITLGELDADTTVRLIEAQLRDINSGTMLEGKLDKSAIWKAANGYVPAFIVEAVTKAKAYAINRNGGSEKITVSSDDIVNALNELRPQWDLMNKEADKHQVTLDEITGAMLEAKVNAKTAVEKVEALTRKLT